MAFEVARALGAPLDVIVVRKLGVPFQPELGMGAIGEGGVRVLNQEIIQRGRISADELGAVEARERAELDRRAFRYRRGRPRQPLEGCTAVVVDDGIATGSTARAACQVARAQGAAGWCWPCPWRRRGGRRAWDAMPTSWSVWKPRKRFTRSGSSTLISPRRLTAK